ncbi:MAG: hypothetical protein ACYSWO_27745 [Planctomycetota bacterium]|jgi:hypothetical protein
MSIISLRPSNIYVLAFNHPLLKDAKPTNEKRIDRLAAAARKDPEQRPEFVRSLLSCLGNLVGRYLFYFPVARRFQDDMVSEGFAAICDLSLDIPPECGILKVASRRIQDRINTFLNDNRGVTAPSLRQQKYLKADGKDVIYRGAVMADFPEEIHPSEAGDEWKRDVLDAISRIETKDELDASLLKRENWGRGYQDLADEFGVGVATIYRRKAALYNQYVELTR